MPINLLTFAALLAEIHSVVNNLRGFYFTAILAEKDSDYFTSLNEEHFNHIRILKILYVSI